MLLFNSTKFFYYFDTYGIFDVLNIFVSLITLFTLLIRGGNRLKLSEMERKSKRGKKGSSGRGNSKGKSKNLIQNDDDDDDEEVEVEDDDDDE